MISLKVPPPAPLVSPWAPGRALLPLELRSCWCDLSSVLHCRLRCIYRAMPIPARLLSHFTAALLTIFDASKPLWGTCRESSPEQTGETESEQVKRTSPDSHTAAFCLERPHLQTPLAGRPRFSSFSSFSFGISYLMLAKLENHLNT